MHSRLLAQTLFASRRNGWHLISVWVLPSVSNVYQYFLVSFDGQMKNQGLPSSSDGWLDCQLDMTWR